MLTYFHLNHKCLNGVAIISSICNISRGTKATITLRTYKTSLLFGVSGCFVMQCTIHRTSLHHSISTWLYQCPFRTNSFPHLSQWNDNFEISRIISTSNLNRLIAVTVQDGIHHFNRCLIHATDQVFKCAYGLSRNKLHTLSVLICQKYIMPAINIPENYIRDFIPMFLIYSGNIIVEILSMFLVCAAINLHIWNDNER